MQLKRLSTNPLITIHSHPSLGNNVDGPSLIRVPPWVTNPLGRYYLYFAHHQGTHIRLAYADDLQGPWQVHAPGVLPLALSGCRDHIASPDVHVDPTRQEIRMYFHGVAFAEGEGTDGHEASFGDAARWVGNQRTRLAVSTNGLDFTAHSRNLGASYFRAFTWEGHTYGLAMPGVLYRSRDGGHRFERGPLLFDARFRHAAVHRCGHTLHVLYSRAGDNPESLLHAHIDLRGDWQQWQAVDHGCVLRPEMPWEGADLPAMPSARGPVYTRAPQLRDPAFFEEDGRLHVLYAIAGEQGIAIAQALLP